MASSAPWPPVSLASFVNTSSVRLPRRGGVIGPAGLYNTATLASTRHQAHPPYGVSLVLLGRC
jgi:hypothetical protein